MKAYVYIWFRPDWSPFYVGIGKTPSRWNPLRAKAKDRNKLCMRILEKHGTHNIRVNLFVGLTWSEACAKEKSLIAHFGRIDQGGLLANFTDGGEGVVSPTQEQLDRKRKRLLDPENPMRNMHRVLNKDPEIKRKRLASLNSAETRIKLSAAAKKRWENPEAKRALSEKMLARWAAIRELLPENSVAPKKPPEEISELRASAMKKRNADPEYTAKRIAALKQSSEQISAGVNRSRSKRLATLATPEVQAKLRKPKTEEHNRKVSEAKKLWWAKRKEQSI
jgi:hypothetical protein